MSVQLACRRLDQDWGESQIVFIFKQSKNMSDHCAEESAEELWTHFSNT